jgi:cob(I)alamin adenosyltransferase
MADSRRGLILINTGPGKGKTTAAMGTALRAVGNGMKVLMLQFLKGSWHYGELDAVQAFGGNFVMRQMGRGFVKVGGAETDPEDVRLVEEAWAEAREAIYSGEWDMVVLDEINYAIGYGMLDPAVVPQRASSAGGAGGYGDRDARGETRLSKRYSGAAGHRILRAWEY